MTRRSIIAAMVAIPWDLSASTEVLIQYRTFAGDLGVNLPSVSDFQSRYGILVDMATGDREVEAYSITVRYDVDNQSAMQEQTKAVLRDRADDSWTSTAFWTGQPCSVREVRVRALVCCAEKVK